MTVVVTVDQTLRGTAVRIAGRLEAGDLPELHRVLNGPVAPLELDLSELLTADADGIDLLRRQRLSGATLVNVPPYIRLLLDEPNGAEED
jgi:hypothetical protein